ncbi:hypothetical protein [Asaia bogorensis]|uniref:hypothetical protein n=1 Tax=Asaia bogorensis TaxID=91915 RepID=UPI000EFC51FB|nr:hypothetical protein [Asaia bogorensis]
MASARQLTGTRAVFWLLSLFAVTIRLATGSPGMTAEPSSDDPLDILSALVVFCDSAASVGPAGKHHDTACADSSACLVTAVEFHAPLLTVLISVIALTGPKLFRCAWCFPPIRGPPCDGFATRYAQGPPSLT